MKNSRIEVGDIYKSNTGALYKITIKEDLRANFAHGKGVYLRGFSAEDASDGSLCSWDSYSLLNSKYWTLVKRNNQTVCECHD
jgi:hypothetical protein